MSAGSRQACASRTLRYTGLKLAEFSGGRAKKRALQGVQATLLRESTAKTITHLASKTFNLILDQPPPTWRQFPSKPSRLLPPLSKLGRWPHWCTRWHPHRNSQSQFCRTASVRSPTVSLPLSNPDQRASSASTHIHAPSDSP